MDNTVWVLNCLSNFNLIIFVREIYSSPSELFQNNLTHRDPIDYRTFMGITQLDWFFEVRGSGETCRVWRMWLSDRRFRSAGVFVISSCLTSPRKIGASSNTSLLDNGASSDGLDLGLNSTQNASTEFAGQEECRRCVLSRRSYRDPSGYRNAQTKTAYRRLDGQILPGWCILVILGTDDAVCRRRNAWTAGELPCCESYASSLLLPDWLGLHSAHRSRIGHLQHDGLYCDLFTTKGVIVGLVEELDFVLARESCRQSFRRLDLGLLDWHPERRSL